MISSPETERWYQNQFSNHNYINYMILPSCEEKLLTLFALILLHHVRLAQSSSSLTMLSLPLLSTDCLSFLPPGGPGPPSPHFPQVPGNSPLPCQAQVRWAVKEVWPNCMSPLSLTIYLILLSTISWWTRRQFLVEKFAAWSVYFTHPYTSGKACEDFLPLSKQKRKLAY